MTIEVKVKTLDHYDSSFELPFYATEGAAGADVRASIPEKKSISIKPGERVLVPTGLSMEIPFGYEVQVRPRSGLSLKSPLMIVNAPGTIDCDYRGEVCIIVGNFGKEDYVVEHGLRIAQLVIAPVIQAKYSVTTTLNETQRGAGGFGSTGTR
ncbi:dUTP diphosphatase [Peredibacter starrii]|uniref:Deoxyuridine 5'-triphosphate nucleotidohydrolase n=1 Tax=Peredibacter starrii TaxID=28202 RepID=A0AAX4HIV9_9BACT|nr:dUTP diphosphatase [Peredibacter starrii]WPU63170.1 dUTP diphosphatase [Peredibacter starrii]